MANILINYSQDILKGTMEILDVSNLRNRIYPGMKISIKPNMVLAKPPSQGATTHSEIVEGLICYLKDCGIRDIEIIESAWVGGNTKQAYHTCGYEELSRRYDVPLFDLKEDTIRNVNSGDYTFEVCQKSIETDFLINVPVLKAHCQTLLTCNLKNLKGCISDREKRRFHTLGLHRPIAYLNKAIKTGFCLVDAICGDLTFEEGGNPVTRNMILAGEDPLLLDSYCAELLGYGIQEIEYLNIAAKIRVGKRYTPDTEIMEINQEEKPVFTKAESHMVRELSSYITEDKACSACYSALIYALYQLQGPALRKSAAKISIGQGFQNQTGDLGCGSCTNRFEKSIQGCPPKTIDIVHFLKEELS